VNETQNYPADLPKRGAEIDGRYRVIEQIGEGSYGWVFSVEHQLLGQTFAMKILHPRIASDPSWVARFREEAKSTSLIGHENIVFVTDFGKCPSYGYYFVMERLEGTTLEEELRDHKPLESARSIRITLQAAGALSAAHDLGIVHRDLKPGNLMLVGRRDGGETCKLLDFGISSIVLSAAKTPKLYGTPAYMAPEQAIQPEVDHRADQFSLATILYEMLTGQTPWQTRCWEDATPEGRSVSPRPPSELGANVSEALDQAILKALSVPFEDRWPSIDDFSRALISAGQVDWIPKSDPLDSFLIDSRDAEDPEVDESASRVSISKRDAGESMVIVLDDGDQEDDFEVRPVVTARFRTAERLYREYRRNLLAGGLFLPYHDRSPYDTKVSELLPLHSEVDLQLVYEPKARSIELRAQVVAHNSSESSDDQVAHVGGFGVAIAAEDTDRLTQFLRSLNLGLELSQSDIVRPIRSPLFAEDTASEMMAHQDMSAAEAFLFSRITEPMPVAQIRVFSSGLPFDVEQGIQLLVEKGLLEVDAADLGALSETSTLWADESSVNETSTGEDDEALAAMPDDSTRFPWSKTDPQTGLEEQTGISYSRDEVSRVLARVRYFRSRQNYYGAMQVLRKALGVSPSVPEFYHQLALLHAQFGGDYPRAFQALHGAIQLDPANKEYQETRMKLEKLAGLDD
jgi:serine/threonine protein kinase